MSNFSVVVFLGKWRARPFHSVSSDLPAHSRPHTRRSVGHGWSPTIFPCGSRANTAGEKLIQTHIYTHTRDKDGTDTQRSFVPPTPLPVINIRFQVQMIHGGIILQSKLSMSFKQYSRKAVLCCTPIDLLFFSPQRRHPNLYCFFEHSNLSCSTTEPRWKFMV